MMQAPDMPEPARKRVNFAPVLLAAVTLLGVWIIAHSVKAPVLTIEQCRGRISAPATV